MIFATDLDRTIIFSSKFTDQAPAFSCVEILDGREISYMTDRALDLLQQVKNQPEVRLIPITTRSRAQFSRIQPLQDVEYAVVANGGIILHQGQPLKVWQDHIEQAKEKQAGDYDKILSILDQYKDHLTRVPSLVDDLFFFTKVPEDAELVRSHILPGIEADLQGLDWTFTLQGLKLYIIPKEVSKENALRFLRTYLKEDRLLTSGDGKLDQGFLQLGDKKMIPLDSEVYQLIEDKSDFQIVSAGMTGAEEILQTVLLDADHASDQA